MLIIGAITFSGCWLLESDQITSLGKMLTYDNVNFTIRESIYWTYSFDVSYTTVRAESGNIFLRLTVDIENLSKSEYWAYYGDWKLVLKGGAEYDAKNYLGDSNAMDLVKIQPYEERTFKLTYELPVKVSEKQMQVQYNNSIFMGCELIWQVK